MQTPVIFLDRDGVINKDSAEYIKTPSEFEFIPQSAEAVAMLYKKGFHIILVTNQSMIGRKMASQQTLEAIFDKMTDGIEQAGGRIKDIFYCPHIPGAGCGCRKPAPGLILAAQKKHNIDLSAAVMIGDSAKDIEVGRNAKVGKTILVKTGNGKKALDQLSKQQIFPDYVARDLYDAALWITTQLQVS